MQKFFVITNEYKDENLTVTRQIKEYIQKKGGACEYFLISKSNWLETGNGENPIPIPEGTDAILVLGGDGTLVRAARDLAPLGIPMIGINMGTLGYLCELDPDTIFDAVDRLFADQYDVESRMLLEGCAQTNGQEAPSACALNDIVLHRTGNSQLISLVVSVNGEYLATYDADGIILATPTGSTGYNMSAGGPIVDPEASLILITPINPHDISSKSIVVGANAHIAVELSARRPERDETADVSFDGDRIIHLHVGDRIEVQKAAKGTKILKLNRVSFLQILRRKMHP